MICLICHQNINKKLQFINSICDCSHKCNLHKECFIHWTNKKNGYYCLICLNLINNKNINIVNKSKKKKFSCF